VLVPVLRFSICQQGKYFRTEKLLKYMNGGLTMTPDQLAKCTGASAALSVTWLPNMEAAMARFEINSPARQAAFLAQIGYESGGLANLVENLNYRPDSLLAQFNNSKITRFSEADANLYGRTDEHPANQTMIANIAYANRNGNGSIQSGDGWKYRGRGLIQITFRSNYAGCSTGLGQDLVGQPDLLAAPEFGAMSAAWFWISNGLNALADAGNIDAISVKINGGSATNDKRRAQWQLAKAALGVA
jgi:putative chitinase